MAAIGSLVFCTACGDLLDGSTGDAKAILTCNVCGTKNRDTSSKTITTVSKPSAFPSILRARGSKIQSLKGADAPQDAMIDQTCPNDGCGATQMRYYTQQLRSADEGTTAFFNCEKCGYKYNTNN